VPLAALFAQPHPEAAVLRIDILDCHAERRPDPRKGIDHQRDQRPMTQPGMLRGIDAFQQLARFRWIEHRRLPTGDDVTRPANSVRRVERHHLAVDQPVEQMAQRCEPLLDRGRCKLTRPCLDPRRHMHG